MAAETISIDGLGLVLTLALSVIGVATAVVGFFLRATYTRVDNLEATVVEMGKELAVAKADQKSHAESDERRFSEVNRSVRDLRGETTNPGVRNPLYRRGEDE